MHAVYTGDVNEAVEGFLKYQLLKLGGAGIVLTHHNPRRHHGGHQHRQQGQNLNGVASGDGGGTAATPAAKARKRPREPELSLPASGAQLRYRHSERPVATGNRPWLATEATKC